MRETGMVGEVGLLISGLDLDGVADLIGLGRSEPSGVSFAEAGEGAAPPEVTWRLEAASTEEASVLLAAQQESLQVGLSGLDEAARALERLTQQAGEPSFALEAGPEAELLATVRQVESGLLSYGMAEAEERKGLGAQWQKLVAQVQRLLVDYAWVETVVAGQRIGKTRVGWSGDFQTAWASGAGKDLVQAHCQAVRAALAARFTLVRLVAVVVSGAVALGIKATLPGGAVLLLPAVWKYVRLVLQAWRQAKGRVEQ